MLARKEDSENREQITFVMELGEMKGRITSLSSEVSRISGALDNMSATLRNALKDHDDRTLLAMRDTQKQLSDIASRLAAIEAGAIMTRRWISALLAAAGVLSAGVAEIMAHVHGVF